MAKVINLKLKEFSKHLEKEFVNNHKEEVKAAVLDACLQSITQFVQVSPVDTGLYSNSWEAMADEKNVYFGNTAPYAYKIEYGTKAYQMKHEEFQRLLLWSARQLKVPPTHKKAKALAGYVYHKIKTEGLEPKYILTNGIEDFLKPYIEENLRLLEKGDSTMKNKAKK